MELKSILIKIVRVLFLTILSILLIAFGYFYSQRQLIKTLIVRSISNKTDNSVQIKKFKFTFEGIILDSLSFDKKGIKITVDNCKIKPNLVNIISKFVLNLKGEKVLVDTASINRGSVILNLDSLSSNDTTKNSKKFDESILNIAKSLSLNNVNIEIKKKSKRILKLDSLCTSYSFDENSKYKYQTKTSVLIDGNKNISTINILSNSISDKISIDLVLNDFSLTKPKKIDVGKQVLVNSGNIDGKINLDIENLSKYSLNGKLFISKFSGSVDDLIVDNLQTEVVFSEKNIKIDNFIFQSANSTVLGDGNFNIESKKYNFNISEGGKISRKMWILNLLKLDDNFDKITGKYNYNISLNNSGAKGTILLNDLKYDDIVKLDEIRAQVKTDFKNIFGNVFVDDSLLSGKFKTNINLKTKKLSLGGNIKSNGFTIKNNGKKIELYSNLKNISYNGKKINIKGQIDSVVVNSINYLKNRVFIDLKKNGSRTDVIINDSSYFRIFRKGKKYSIVSHIENDLWHNDINLPVKHIEDLTSDFNFRANLQLKNGSANFNSNVTVDFKKERPQLSGKVGFDVIGSVGNRDKYIKIIGWKSNFVKFNNKIFKPTLNVELIDSVLNLNRLSIGNERVVLSGVFSKNSLNGVLNFYNYNLNLEKINKIPVSAKLNGNIFIRGSLENPIVRSLVNISNLNIKHSGNYSINLDLKYKDKILKNMTDILYENRGYSLGKITKLEVSDKIKLEAEGTNLKIFQLSKKLEELKLSGDISYRLNLEGNSVDSLTGQLIFDGENIKLKKHQIKNMYTSISLEDKNLVLNDFSAITDEVSVNIKGKYPLDKLESDSLNFFIDVKGGILKEANKDIKLFPKIVNEKSIAKINLCSRDKKFKIKGKLNFNFDTLFIPTVVDYVANANISVDLKQNILSDIIGTGNIGKDSVRVTNYVYNKNRDFHLYLKPLDIDFGVIGLTTTKNGIPFNFKVYQKPTDRGRVIPEGVGNFPIFSFTGPIATPGLRGTLKLKDTEFTFPSLYESNKKLPSFLQLQLNLIGKENVFYYLSLRKYLKDQEVVRAKLNSGGNLFVKGPLIPDKLKLTGTLGVTNNGKVFYGQDFKIENAKVEFVPFLEKGGSINNTPIISMKAYSMIRDENGFPKKVYLVLKIKEKGAEYYTSAGRPGELKLEMDNIGSLDPMEARKLHNDVFGTLFGIDYGDEETSQGKQVTRKGIEFGESYVFNTYISNFLMAKIKIPYIDVISVDSKIFSNYYDLMDNSDTRADWGLLNGSSFEVGSFIHDRIYLNYKGIIKNDINFDEVGITHSAGAEIYINQMIQLQLGVKYDPKIYNNPFTGYYGIMFNIPFDI